MQRGLLDIGFGRFDIIEACDRQTDGLRDRHPATAHTHNTRIAYASRLKKIYVVPVQFISVIFGRPFIKRFPLSYRDRCLSVLSCLSSL